MSALCFFESRLSRDGLGGRQKRGGAADTGPSKEFILGMPRFSITRAVVCACEARSHISPYELCPLPIVPSRSQC